MTKVTQVEITIFLVVLAYILYLLFSFKVFSKKE